MSGKTKKCPKCGNDFECNNQQIESCGCMQVPLDPTTRQKIAAQYNDCLCVSCLKALAEE